DCQYFFFSSRGRHTRFSRDWSSDVCSSDLGLSNAEELALGTEPADPDTDADTIADGEEVGNPAAPSNSDATGPTDALDTDSDDDGIPDIDEAGDGDLGTAAANSDGADLPDYRDLDSDNDG